MSLLLEALKKAEKAKRRVTPPAQAEKEHVAPANATLAPPTMEAEAQMPAGESLFPEIMLDDVAPPEPPLAMTTLQPEPDVREPLLLMPDLAVVDLPEMELAGMRSDAQTEPEPEAKTEPVLSLDFPEPEQTPQPTLQPAVLDFEPAPAIAQESTGGLHRNSPEPEPPRTTYAPAMPEHPPAAPQTAPAPMPEQSAPPPPPPAPRLPPKAADDAAQATMGGAPPNSQAGQAGLGDLPPNSHKTPEQETAKKILAAKQGKPKRNPKLLAGLLVVSMAVGAAAAYFYWEAVTQPTLSFPAPQTAETPPEADAPQQPAEADDSAAQPAPAQPPAGDAGAGEEALAGARSNAQAGQAGMGGLPPNSQKPSRREPAAVDAARTPKGEQSVEKPASSPKQRDATPAEAPAAKKTAVPPIEPDQATVKSSAIAAIPVSGIKIRRDVGEAKLDPLLASAYQAFMAGETGKAESDYRKALQRTPNSRDALLGLAAIAAGRNQVQEAASLYLRVLQLDPGDSAAQTGLIGLKGNADPTVSESRLKILLAQSPGTGYLHFALGNLYAQQLRWPEAQEAYFNALHTDPGNADYAFNLAVSLDHLDQRRPALVYYQRARNLVKERPAGFNGEQVEKRIYELQRLD
jgi:tetratricopeptide (TPR) repeat protein